MTRPAAATIAVRWVAVGPVFLLAWLFLTAAPAFADGGPHVAVVNSGAGAGSSLAADSCAGCHRAHTAQGAMLLAAPTEEALCLSCHGVTGLGATTDVEDGVQFGLGSTTVRGGAVAGALRSGGFVNARIDSSHISRIVYPSVLLGTLGSAKVPVLTAGAPVTSAHIALATGVVAKGIAWANGGTGAGQPLSLGCTTCHNPHGNGQYRILVPLPGDGTGPLVEDTIPANVTDAALPAGAGAVGVRNYTVLWGRTLADVVNGTYPDGGVGPNDGDYFRRYLPWNGVPGSTVTGLFGDRPMYVPGGTNLNSFRAQITQWCSTCHTRDDRLTGADVDTGDPIFTYRHTVGNVECTVCHVAHGSNAAMAGAYSSTFPYPDSTTGSPDLSGSSRLLKIDNRGTCQACHDPTKTVPAGTVTTPTP